MNKNKGIELKSNATTESFSGQWLCPGFQALSLQPYVFIGTLPRTALQSPEPWSEQLENTPVRKTLCSGEAGISLSLCPTGHGIKCIALFY